MGLPVTLLVVVVAGGGVLSWFAGRAVVKSKELSRRRKFVMASLTPVAVLLAVILIAANFSRLSQWGDDFTRFKDASFAEAGQRRQAKQEIAQLLKNQGFSYQSQPDIGEDAQSGTVLAWIDKARMDKIYAFKRDGQWVLACQYGDAKKPLEGEFLKEYNKYGGCPVIDAVAPATSTSPTP